MSGEPAILDPHQVLVFLRKAGITVHMVRASLTGTRLVIYLEALHGQQFEAMEKLEEITTDVQRETPGILTCNRTPKVPL